MFCADCVVWMSGRLVVGLVGLVGLAEIVMAGRACAGIVMWEL
eukprot:SAG22_NODE_1251_length_5005_cov_22.891154_3_plen_43_part_00